MKTSAVLPALALTALLLSGAGGPALAGQLEIARAWVREAPPGARVLAAYLEITNRGQVPRRLLAASSPDAEAVELHRSVLSRGLARMERMTSLSIEPGSTIRLEPGGLHLMVMEPARAFEQGDTLRLDLEFDKAETLRIEAPVRPQTGPRRRH